VYSDQNLGVQERNLGFFLSSAQFIGVGIVREYAGAICTQVRRPSLVIERERINFEHATGPLRAHEPATDGSVVEEHRFHAPANRT
jgi:hypothetical protein